MVQYEGFLSHGEFPILAGWSRMENPQKNSPLSTNEHFTIYDIQPRVHWDLFTDAIYNKLRVQYDYMGWIITINHQY